MLHCPMLVFICGLRLRAVTVPAQVTHGANPDPRELGVHFRPKFRSDFAAGTGAPLGDLAKPTAFPNLFLVPSKPELAGAAVELAGREGGEPCDHHLGMVRLGRRDADDRTKRAAGERRAEADGERGARSVDDA